MTILDLWNLFLQYGVPSACLAVATYLLFSGRVVNGETARIARESEVAEVKAAYTVQISLLTQRFEEMQTIWRERYTEASKDRDYYRTMALSFAKQAEQGIALAQDRMPSQ